MTLRKHFSFLILGVIALALSACTYTTGDGPVVEKGFAKDPFQGVSLDGSFDVNIKQGAVQNVVISGNENIIDKLRMDVMDGVLYISLEPGNYFNYDLMVNLTMTTLESVALDGSGDIVIGTFVGLDNLEVRLDGSGDINSDGVLEASIADINLDGSGDIDLKLKAKEVTVLLQGSGDIDLAGTTSKLSVELEGSGDINAFKLESLNCEAVLDGSGDIRVYASENLDAQLDGSGSIRYKGEPKVNAEIDGAGTVEAD